MNEVPYYMSDPFIGEIRLFAGKFAPEGWAFCNGEILNIRGNEPLYSILQNRYGGDGKNTFSLPNMQGKIPLCFGQGPGLSSYRLGDSVGSETATLNSGNIPSHSHTGKLYGLNEGSTNVPEKSVFGRAIRYNSYSNDKSVGVKVNMAENSLALSEWGAKSPLPHSNMQSTLALSFIIALTGIYPTRS